MFDGSDSDETEYLSIAMAAAVVKAGGKVNVAASVPKCVADKLTEQKKRKKKHTRKKEDEIAFITVLKKSETAEFLMPAGVAISGYAETRFEFSDEVTAKKMCGEIAEKTSYAKENREIKAENNAVYFAYEWFCEDEFERLTMDVARLTAENSVRAETVCAYAPAVQDGILHENMLARMGGRRAEAERGRKDYYEYFTDARSLTSVIRYDGSESAAELAARYVAATALED